ncbi:MAG: threonylcarbamoyl-AMP synthase [Verrucomicrobia bacterium]|nr:threonylcarbamoyl-AMP synthase [Verrucomicrobiota bacterium]
MLKRPLARIYRGTARNLALLARRLRAGDVVAVPTETVYGLAANALDATACEKIFQAKGRPTTDPLIVHIHSLGQLAQVCEPNAAALTLAKKFWPGPLTLVLPKRPVVPGIVTAGKKSVAVRMPSHPAFRRLLALARIPLAAPSANPFGGVSPTTAKHVREGLGIRISHILDGGPAQIGLESTIVDLRNPQRPRLLRLGAVTQGELERVLRRRVPLVARAAGRVRDSRAQIAPGLLARHYSPATPVVLHAKIVRAGDANEAFVFLRRPRGQRGRNVFWLDARGELPGVARRLFATLLKIDAMQFAKIHVELAPGDGLAHAINDRLRHAAAR